jgi:hypothetical protein
MTKETESHAEKQLDKFVERRMNKENMAENKKEIENNIPTIEIEGINIKDLSKEAIDFYFKCSKKQIEILREYLEKVIQSKEKEMLDDEINFNLKLLGIPFENHKLGKECSDELCPNRYAMQDLVNKRLSNLKERSKGINGEN